jgi:D-threo-aldose 1-dehydrogenase
MEPMKKRKFQRAEVNVSEISTGTVQIGNLFRALSNEDAEKLLVASWDHGSRYFDTAPYYGHGLSEHRIGHYLQSKPRDEFVISTKVGRSLIPAPIGTFSHGEWADVPGMRVDFDYSYEGVMKQFESSLQRLLMNRVDILLLHDADHYTHGKDQPKMFKQAMNGAIPALQKLREEGVVQAIGAGFNDIDCLIDLVNQADIDCLLVAGRYTLLEQNGAKELMDLCESRGVSIILGSIFNSGILATGVKPGARYHYETAKPEVLSKVSEINRVCEEFGVSLPAAAIQFATAHPAVASVCIGASKVGQIESNHAYATEAIPLDFWSSLREKNLISDWAPTPGHVKA